MARDFTNFDAGCHGPVPLEARICFSFPWSPLDVRAPSVARVGTRRARSHGRRRTRQEFRDPHDGEADAVREAQAGVIYSLGW